MKIIDIVDFKDGFIKWLKHPAREGYWISNYKTKTVYLRLNNFPDESLYTLISENQIEDLDNLPEK